METYLQMFLRTGGTFQELQERYAIEIKTHPAYPNLHQFVYNQIDSPMGNPVVQDCRGIILDSTNNWSVVCMTYRKFFNYGEGHAARLEAPIRRYDKRDGCFQYNTPIKLSDGTTRKIGEIVNKKLQVELLGVNPQGKLVNSKIRGWKNNGTKDNWLRIETGGKQALTVTTNHKIHINGGWKFASEACIGDNLTLLTSSPSDSVLHVISSGLLGDGSLCPNGIGYKYSEGHVAKHKEYSDTIQSWLGECSIRQDMRISGYGSEIHRIASKTYRVLRQQRTEWYGDKVRRVPKDLSWMDDFSVAKWYMDDGSRGHSEYQKDRAVFSTHRFRKNDVVRLAHKLTELYGVDAVVIYSKGWCIRVNAGKHNSIKTFWGAIAPHIVPCMRYKLPKEYADAPYTERPTGTEHLDTTSLKITKITPLSLTKENFPSGRCGYDIQTETGNYFANDILVHNSLIQLYWYDWKWHVATSGNPAAAGEVFGHGKSFAQLFWETWKQRYMPLPIYPKYCYAFELTSPYNKIVVRYPDANIYLHGVRNLVTLQEEDPEIHAELNGWKCVPFVPIASPEEAVEMAKELNALYAEGFVLVDPKFNRVKVKSPQYIAMHHLKDGMSQRRLLEIIRSGDTDEFLIYFPEFTDDFKYISDKYEAFLKGAEKIWEMSKPIPGQWEFAQAIKDTPYAPALFKLRAGKINSLKEFYKDVTIQSLERWIGLK